MAVLGDEAAAEDADESKHLHSLLGGLLTAVAAAIVDAADVSVVLRSLHPLASLLFSVPKNSISAVTEEDEKAEAGLKAIEKRTEACRKKAVEETNGEDTYQTLRHALYNSSHFPTLSTLLLHQIAAEWLACFPSWAVKWLFDEFFRQAPAMEVLLNLVPYLGPGHRLEEKSDVGLDSRTAVSAQVKRLLQICLVQQNGVEEIGLSFGHRSKLKLQEGGLGNIGRSSWLKDIFQVAQIIASIPDRTGLDAPTTLQSPVYYELVSRQLLSAAERSWEQSRQMCRDTAELGDDGTFVFTGEVISKLCRRGQADVIATICLPVLMQHVKEAMITLDAQSDPNVEMKESAPQAPKFSSVKNLWTGISVCIKDSHAMEKWVEALLREMAVKVETDVQAYCILWLTFGSLLSKHSLTRMVLLEKCLLVKILPIRCLRWILQFGVLHKPTASVELEPEKRALQIETEVVSRLAQVWSSNDFIRTATLPKQAYLTAAVGICIRSMVKDDIDRCQDVMRSILQGVQNRLESPLPLVREMSKRVALAFSLAINPGKPLHLDDELQLKDLDNWDDLSLKAVVDPEEDHQTATTQSNQAGTSMKEGDVGSSKIIADPAPTDAGHRERRRQRKERREKMALEEDDPDAVVNLGQDDATWLEDAGGSAADSSSDIDSDNEGSLQPYDMSDDESELERRKLPSQLRECAANLRKTDDFDAVEKALQVAEQLIRAKPVELDNTAEELAQALLHVRPGEIAVEGEEDKRENQRHDALVALLACAPLSSIVIATQEVYSPHLDISQRLLLLDTISEAAQELAGKRTVQSSRPRSQQGLIKDLTGPAGAGPWSEVPALLPGDSMVSWAQRYERELPLRKSDRRLGTSRKWAPRSMQLREERQSISGFSSHEASGKNLFAPLAAAFMLPIMRYFDMKTHGVDFLGSGFIVLGKILYTLGVCMDCIIAQPEAVVLGANLLELLRSRAVATHPEAYVRRAALYAASRVIVALHPSQVVTAITDPDSNIGSGLEWVREWALGIANNDPDSDCAAMAMACVQLHSEMALQAMRAIQSTPSNSQSRIIQTRGERAIIMPF